MITSIIGILIVLFVAFCVRGGLALRFGGMFLMAGAALNVLMYNNTIPGIVVFFVGILLWLLGHWAYVFAYDEYKSAVAEYLIEGMHVPQLEIPRRLYALQSRLRQGLRTARPRLHLAAAPQPTLPASPTGQSPHPARAPQHTNNSLA